MSPLLGLCHGSRAVEDALPTRTHFAVSQSLGIGLLR